MTGAGSISCLEEDKHGVIISDCEEVNLTSDDVIIGEEVNRWLSRGRVCCFIELSLKFRLSSDDFRREDALPLVFSEK